jgi:hypothetical protein
MGKKLCGIGRDARVPGTGTVPGLRGFFIKPPAFAEIGD